MGRSRRDSELTQTLVRELEDLISAAEALVPPTVSAASNRHRQEMDRMIIELERERREAERLIQQNIMSSDSPVDETAMDLLNAIRAAQQRNEVILGSEDPTQNKVLNLRELHKMVQAICEYLEIQLIEVPSSKQTDYRKYRAVRKGAKPGAKPIDRSKDLILIEEDDEDGNKG